MAKKHASGKKKTRPVCEAKKYYRIEWINYREYDIDYKSIEEESYACEEHLQAVQTYCMPSPVTILRTEPIKTRRCDICDYGELPADD